jgi:hypothetical protein
LLALLFGSPSLWVRHRNLSAPHGPPAFPHRVRARYSCRSARRRFAALGTLPDTGVHETPGQSVAARLSELSGPAAQLARSGTLQGRGSSEFAFAETTRASVTDRTPKSTDSPGPSMMSGLSMNVLRCACPARSVAPPGTAMQLLGPTPRDQGIASKHSEGMTRTL